MTASPLAGTQAPAGAPPRLAFAVAGAEPARYAAVPTLVLKLRVERVGGGEVRSIALNTQLRIAATRRSYDDRAEQALYEVFGPPEQWSRSLRSFLWTNVSLQVPAFTDSTEVELAIVCTYDFDVTAAKYLNALEDGEVPLELHFGGSVFYPGEGGQLRVAPMSWDMEAEYRLPVQVWRDLMDRYFPNSAWLRLRKDSFDRLYAFKARRSLLSWEDALDALLDEAQDS